MKLPFNVDLTNKVVVITGAGGVICGNYAKALATCNAKIAILDINLSAARSVEQEILKDGGIAKAYQADVLDKKSLETVRKQILQDFGTCDILINGAGGNNPRATTDVEYYLKDIPEDSRTFFDLDASGIEFVFNLNFLGTLLPTQVFVKDMVEKDYANIINISSMNAFRPLTKIPAYSGAKAAISNFTQWLAVHFSKTNIRVNAIAPGFFVTNQNKQLLFNDDGSPTARTEKILRNTPMGRFGSCDELIGALLFLLCENASSFITGIVLPVDGGFSAYSGV